MRILLVSNLFPPDVLGGYELLADDVARALRARGLDVHVLTSGSPRAEDPRWVHRWLDLVRPFGEPPRRDRLRHVLAARRQARVVDELVAAHGPFDVALYLSLRRLGLHVPRALQTLGVPGLWLFNDDWILAHAPADGETPLRSAAIRLLERGPLRARTWAGVRIDRAIHVSGSIADALQARGVPIRRGRVVWQGVDLRLFSRGDDRDESVSTRAARSPRLLFVGRLHPTKGCDLAIESLARLRAAGVDATLSVAGRGEADEEQRLRALASSRGVDAAVDWLGFVPRAALPAVYRAHDVFLFPSTWAEPAGLTYLEAMACGVPVVGLARGGAAELLRHDENALVADDARGITDGVMATLADPTATARRVAEGRRTVLDRASLARYVDAIAEDLEASARSVLSEVA